jgi:hypothetical protein
MTAVEGELLAWHRHYQELERARSESLNCCVSSQRPFSAAWRNTLKQAADHLRAERIAR